VRKLFLSGFVTPCSPVDPYQCFKEKHAIIISWSSFFKVEVAHSSEMPVITNGMSMQFLGYSE
jgi:hypothetical protein